MYNLKHNTSDDPCPTGSASLKSDMCLKNKIELKWICTQYSTQLIKVVHIQVRKQMLKKHLLDKFVNCLKPVLSSPDPITP